MCGVVGVYGHPEAANLAYLGLYALQHRGQESAGIVSTDGDKLRAVREMGHVNDIFTANRLKKDLPGPRGDRPRALLDRGRLIQAERPADRGRLRGRLGRGRPQRQPGQRGRAARAAGGGRRDLPDDLRHRVHRSPHRALARADAARARRGRASPGARRLLAGLPDRDFAGRRARSDGVPAAGAGQGRGRPGSSRRRPARSSCWAPSSCATSSRARWSSSTSAGCAASGPSASSRGTAACSSGSTSRGRTRPSTARRSTGPASGWGAGWPSSTRSRPTSSSRCPTRASPPPSATRARAASRTTRG